MNQRKTLGLLAGTVLLALPAIAGSLTLVTSKSQLNPNDYAPMPTTGYYGLANATPVQVTTYSGLHMTLTQNGLGLAGVQGANSYGWPIGATIYYNQGGGQLVYDFDQNISGFGALTASSFLGTYTTSIEALNRAGASLGKFTHAASVSGQAEYLGVLDTENEIARVIVSNMAFNPNYIYIGSPDLLDNVPEPGTLGLSALTLLASVTLRWRRRLQ